MHSKHWLDDEFPKERHFLKALLFFAILFLGIQLIQTVWMIMAQMQGSFTMDELIIYMNSYPWSFLLLSLLWIGIFIFILKKAGLTLFQKRTFDKHGVLTMVGGFVAIMVFQMLGSLIVTQLYPDQLISVNQQILNEAMQSMSFLRMFLAFCVLAPIQEEVMMRGLIMRYMFPNHPWIGIIISALLFAALHVTTLWIHFLIYFVMGLILAIIYYKTGRIEYAIGGHFLNNLIGILPIV